MDVTPDQRHHAMLVLAHQQVEGRAVAALHAPDQLEVQLLGWINFGHAGPHSCRLGVGRAL